VPEALPRPAAAAGGLLAAWRARPSGPDTWADALVRHRIPRRRSLHVGTQPSTRTAGVGPGSPESHWSARRSRRDPYRDVVIDKGRTQAPGVGPGRLHIKSSAGTPHSISARLVPARTGRGGAAGRPPVRPRPLSRTRT